MTYLNDVTLKSTVRSPKAQVLINGQEVPGLTYASLRSTNNFQCDTFDLDFALWHNPKFGPMFWDQDTLEVDIRISVPDIGKTTDFQSVLLGLTDKVDIDYYNGTVKLAGRDKTSLFLDAKIQETYQNQTSSQIVQTLAANHSGITFDVDPTTTRVGGYYNHNESYNATGEFTKTTTEWNLICFLAQQEDYDVWVKGNVIHFKKKVEQDPTPWYINALPPKVIGPGVVNHYPTRQESITLTRQLTLAKQIRVEAYAYNPATGRYMSKAVGPAPTGRNVVTYRIQVPGVTTEDQLLKKATARREDISRNERVIQWKEPATDSRLTPRNMVTFVGTGTTFDNQPYYIQEIIRTYSDQEGFFMSVTAKNHSVDSTGGIGPVSG